MHFMLITILIQYDINNSNNCNNYDKIIINAYSNNNNHVRVLFFILDKNIETPQ